MRIFLDTSVLGDSSLHKIGKQLFDHYLKGDGFYVSSITHFQLMWVYAISGRSPEKYEDFVKQTRVEIAPLTKTDAEVAARMKPSRADLLDALISSCVKRYDGYIWTGDRDFLKFLPKTRVEIF